MKRQFRSEFIKEWPRTLLDSILPYKKAQLINGQQMAQFVSQGGDLFEKDVYCGVFMIKAGRQYSVVRYKDENFVQKDLVKFREEEATFK